MLLFYSCDTMLRVSKRKSKKKALKLDEKDHYIVDIISMNPGIRYRELLRLTGLSNGVLSYHIKRLERCKLININRARNRFTTFYLTNVNRKESVLNDYMRSSKTATQLVELLNKQNKSSLKELVTFTKRVPSTISWHIKRLERAGIIYSRVYGKNRLYMLKNKIKISHILINFPNHESTANIK
jgi:predicted transcriptional regulator